jgi:curved DNA-binding protein CbpA
MLNFWKRKPSRADNLKLARKFVRLVITIGDTPTLIRRVAEQQQFMLCCSVVIKADKNTDPEHFSLYRDIEQESYRQGFSFDKLKEKLTTIAGALALDIKTIKSIHADYYQILGVPQNADIRTIKKAFRAKARQTHPDTTSGENDRFLLVLKAYKVLTDPSFRKDNLSKQQKAQWQWSEFSKDHQKGDTLKKTPFRKYGVHFLLIVILLVLTSLVADFVMQQRALVDGVHRAVVPKKQSPENQNSHQDVEYKDEEQLISDDDKPIDKLEESPTNESLLVIQHIQPQNKKEILDEIYIKENQNSRPHVESKDEERLISSQNKPLNKNVKAEKPLKIINKKHEKKIDINNVNGLKIGKTDHKDSESDKLSDSTSLDSEKNNHPTDHHASSIIDKAHDVPFPDLQVTKKKNDVVAKSETVLLDKTLQVKKELEKFFFRYCEAYEKRNLTKLMRFFEENAIENGMPLNQLLSEYKENFQNLASIHYRINIVNYTIMDPDFSRIRVNGHFFLRWQKIREKQWHQYHGKIHFDLISNGDSFLIRELTYRFTD